MKSHSEKKSGVKAPLIVHVIFRLDIGGLENGLVNLINQTPSGVYRHAIICITCATEFRHRIKVDDVPIIELNKRPGKDLAVYWRFFRAVRALKPDVIHTRNVNTLEFQPLALLAGVRARVHGEHGWDIHDLHGTSRKYRVLRKVLRPFVDQFIVVSRELRNYLTASVGIPPAKIDLIYNGVNSNKFCPRTTIEGQPETGNTCQGIPIVIGTIGRMKEVKNQRLLVQAFITLTKQDPDDRSKSRLVMVGDGPLRRGLMDHIKEAGVRDMSSFPGACSNIVEQLREIDIFVLPSRNEGISNTILEAMAVGLPVVATRVGGTPEIVLEDVTGILVHDNDVSGLVSAISRYIEDSELRRRHGMAARERVQVNFNLDAMVSRYMDVYRRVLH